MNASADADLVDNGYSLVMTKTSLAQTPSMGSSESSGAAESISGSSGAKDMEEEASTSIEVHRQASDGAGSLGTPAHEHAVSDAVSHDTTPPPPKNRFPKSFQRFKRLPTASQYVSARKAAESVKNAGTTGRNMQIFRKPGLTNLGEYLPPKPPAPGA